MLGLKSNMSLHHLELSGNMVSDSTKLQIEELLRRNRGEGAHLPESLQSEKGGVASVPDLIVQKSKHLREIDFFREGLY